MTKEEIINGSKLIAEYMGMEYIPFSTDMKHKSAGWYQVKDATPTIEEVTQTAYKVGEEDKAVVTKFKMDTNKLKYHVKNGWNLVGDRYYKFVCRHHGDLRYFNSLDSLVPVIQKIEKEFRCSFYLYNNGCSVGYGYLDVSFREEFSSFDLSNWNQNIFAVIVSFLREKDENK